jgi:Uma2 family endonuclease
MSSFIIESPGLLTGLTVLRTERGDDGSDVQVVEKIMGAQASRVVQNVNRLVDNYAHEQQLGAVFPSEGGYEIFADKPKFVRKPDGSFIRRGRLPDDKPPLGWFHIHPDLVMEVVSPHDLATEIEDRITDYLQAGVPLMWVFYPKNRTVYAYRQGGSATRLTAADELSGEDVLPGFTCRVEESFAGI